jgi:hypothetical protein
VSFPRYATFVCGASSLALLVNLAWLPVAIRGAVALGVALAALNALSAYGLALWSLERSNTQFFGVVLGGMLVRMTVMLGAVLAAILLGGIPAIPLVSALVVGLFLFLSIEIWAIHTAQNARPRAAA